MPSKNLRNTCRKACCNNKKNVGAKWANYLDKCKTINPCKNAMPIQPIISNNESSKIMKSRITQHSHRGWRRVSWSKFKLEQQTKSFKTKIIGKSDLFNPGKTRCPFKPDTTPPIITLNGDNPLNYYLNDIFNDPGATAWDNYNEDITSSITKTITNDQKQAISTINMATSGIYTITYAVKDEANNNAIPLIRTVNVTQSFFTYNYINR